MRLYVIRDIVASKCSPVFEAVNDQVAVRMFDKTAGMSDYPCDYVLMFVGEIDDNGILTSSVNEDTCPLIIKNGTIENNTKEL